MIGFKLLAITPLKDCSRDFCKNLQPGTPYKFYDGYEIIMNKDGSAIKSVKKKEGYNEVENLYELKNGIKLSFSAVVGKNGSGKSALFELFYYLVYVIGVTKFDNDNNNNIFKPFSDSLLQEITEIEKDYNRYINIFKVYLKLEKGGNLNEFEEYVLNNDYEDPKKLSVKLIQKHSLKLRYSKLNRFDELFGEVAKSLSGKKELLENEKKKVIEIEDKIFKELNVSIVYENDNKIFEIALNSGSIKVYTYCLHKKETAILNSKDFLDKFFYSISLNYSHHSLNAKTLGGWINKLFYKNDAYKTPLVISPFRIDGNFDINQELFLSKERLMTSIIYELFHKKEAVLLGKYTVTEFLFSAKEKYRQPSPIAYDKDYINSLKSASLFHRFLKIDKIDDYIPFWDLAINYLEKKIPKIEEKYDDVINPDNKFDIGSIPLNDFLFVDKSHITKKVRQTLNFLKMSYEKENRYFWKKDDNPFATSLSSKKILEWIGLFYDEKQEISPMKLIECALPGFFNVDYVLKETNGETIKFSQLSSGEQQQIFNLNTILYHLHNLQSVHRRSENKDNEDCQLRIKYSNVNIILDEIELYYHPDMQRKLVNHLKHTLENARLKSEVGVESINVCLITHSPFILSDIPSSNVLKLKKGNPEPFDQSSETFGANVHDLLANEFFMEDGFMGEFAKEKIKSVISSLQYEKLTNQLKEMEQEGMLEMEQKNKWLRIENELDELKEETKLDKTECEQIIRVIGEPVLYHSLMELYGEAYPENKDDFIDAQIELLTQLRKK